MAARKSLETMSGDQSESKVSTQMGLHDYLSQSQTVIEPRQPVGERRCNGARAGMFFITHKIYC